MRPVLTRTVWLLGLVSLFADIASEMLYPVLPVYLKSIGFSVALIGLLEGLAEATAGLSKAYFGKMSDRSGLRLPFVRWGYFASAVAKPLIGLFSWWPVVFAARTLDRLGKGLRTGARDALLSDEARPEAKGRVFGFHRSMDTLGAVLGPLLALVWLFFRPGDYRTLFVLAFAPGLLSVLCTFLVREKFTQPAPTRQAKGAGFFAFAGYWKHSTPQYRRLVAGLLVFQIFNSSDTFLLLKMKTAGLSDGHLIGVYLFYNAIFALFSYPLGILADRLGMKKVFLAGLGLFALTYAGFALNRDLPVFYVLFLGYGLYAAATQGVAKAWISNLCEKKETATAIGTYAGFQSLAALLASALAGGFWEMFGENAPFLLSAAGACGVMVYFARFLNLKNS